MIDLRCMSVQQLCLEALRYDGVTPGSVQGVKRWDMVRRVKRLRAGAGTRKLFVRPRCRMRDFDVVHASVCTCVNRAKVDLFDEIQRALLQLRAVVRADLAITVECIAQQTERMKSSFV